MYDYAVSLSNTTRLWEGAVQAGGHPAACNPHSRACL